MADRIQLRRDTAANWTAYNPILLEGEPGIEIDTDQWKLGDGVHTWSQLAYRGGECVQQRGQSTTVAMSQKAVTDELNKCALGTDVINLDNSINLIRNSFLRNFPFVIGSITAEGEMAPENHTRLATEGFIPVSPNFIISNSDTTFGIAQYSDSNIESFISITHSWINSIKLDKNTKYIKLLLRKSDNTDISINEMDSIISSFESSLVISNVGADNISLLRYDLDNTKNKLFINPYDFILGSAADTNGIYACVNNRITNRNLFRCNPNTIITNSSYQFGVYEYNEQQEYIVQPSSWINPGDSYSIKNSNCCYCRLLARKSDDGVIDESEVFGIASGFTSVDTVDKLSKYALNTDVINLDNNANLIRNSFLKGFPFIIGSITAEGVIAPENHTRLATEGFIPVSPNYRITNSNTTFCVFEYSSDNENSFIQKTNWINSIFLNKNTKYIKLLLKKNNDSVISITEMDSIISSFESSLVISNLGTDNISLLRYGLDNVKDELFINPYDFILGASADTDGIYAGSNIRITNRNLFRCNADSVITNSSYEFVVYEYNEQKEYILHHTSWINPGGVYHILSSNCRYCRLIARKPNNAAIDESEVFGIASGFSSSVGEYIYDNVKYSDTIRAGINASTGAISANNTRLLTPAIKCYSGDIAYAIDGYDFSVTEWDENGVFISCRYWFNNTKYTIKHDGYVRIGLRKANDAVISEQEMYQLSLNMKYERNPYNNNKVTYATDFHSEEDSLYDRVKANIDSNTLTLLVATDTHAEGSMDRNKYAAVHRIIAERIGCDAVVHLGDMINQGSTPLVDNRDRLASYMACARGTYIPFLYAIGHHEMYNWHEETNTYDYPREKVLPFTSRFTRYCDVVYDDNNKCNYYCDFDMQGIRCIILDSVDKRWGFTTETVNWLSSVLSNSLDKKIVLFAHVTCIKSANWWVVQPFNGEDIKNLLNGFINNGGTVLGYIHGHNHWDNIVKNNDMSFVDISLCCGVPIKASDGYNNVSGTPTFYDRVIGEYSEYCFDIICLHADTGVINMFRFGAGTDRTYNPQS